jgi:hypothetical protein
MATKKNNKNNKNKKTDKKIVVVDEQAIYKTFVDEVSEVHYSLFNLKDDAFNGDVTHKDLVERLVEMCHALDKALDTVDGNVDAGYDDDEDDWELITAVG